MRTAPRHFDADQGTVRSAEQVPRARGTAGLAVMRRRLGCGRRNGQGRPRRVEIILRCEKHYHRAGRRSCDGHADHAGHGRGVLPPLHAARWQARLRQARRSEGGGRLKIILRRKTHLPSRRQTAAPRLMLSEQARSQGSLTVADRGPGRVGTEAVHVAAEREHGAGRLWPVGMVRANAAAMAHPSDRPTEVAADRGGRGPCGA